jgi:hypothetical protein
MAHNRIAHAAPFVCNALIVQRILLHCKLDFTEFALYPMRMLKRPKKTQIVIRLNDALLSRLDAEAARIGRTRTEVVHRAMESYLDSLSCTSKPIPAQPRKSA